MTAIEFKNVYKKFGDTYALKDFSIKIEENDFLCVVGSSGCGKTTMLKLINGLIFSDKGEILINGKDINTLDLIALRRSMGYVIQEIGLFTHLNVANNIAYVLNLQKCSKEETGKKVDEIMEVVGLDPSYKTRYPGELSGGQRQRVGIARAIVARPKVLLMDEPFSATDEITRNNLQEELLNIYNNFNVTVVFITHDIKEALRLGTKILVMNSGIIEQLGTPKEVLNSPSTHFVKTLISSNYQIS